VNEGHQAISQKSSTSKCLTGTMRKIINKKGRSLVNVLGVFTVSIFLNRLTGLFSSYNLEPELKPDKPINRIFRFGYRLTGTGPQNFITTNI